MKIEILENFETEVNTSETEKETETFQIGEILTVDYLGDSTETIKEEFPQFQFGNGDLVFINKKCFKILSWD